MAALSRPAAISTFWPGSLVSSGAAIFNASRNLLGIGPMNWPQSRLKASMLTALPVFLKGAVRPLSSTPSISGIIPSAWSGASGCAGFANSADIRSRLATSRDLSAKRPTFSGPCGVRPSRPSTANSLTLPLSRLKRIADSFTGPSGVSIEKPRISALPIRMPSYTLATFSISARACAGVGGAPPGGGISASRSGSCIRDGRKPTSSIVMPSIRIFRPCPFRPCPDVTT